MLIFSEAGASRDNLAKLNTGFYSLINSKAYVKKPNREKLKVNTPQGRSELNCPPEQIRETIFLAEGIPIDNIRLLTGFSSCEAPSSYLVDTNFELEILLKLKCAKCERVAKYEYSIALIHMNFACECGSQDFSIVELSSNKKVPLWIDGVKVGPMAMRYKRGGFIRAMGCTDCWRFNGCEPQLCGCWKCGDCVANCTSECILCSL